MKSEYVREIEFCSKNIFMSGKTYANIDSLLNSLDICELLDLCENTESLLKPLLQYRVCFEPKKSNYINSSPLRYERYLNGFWRETSCLAGNFLPPAL
jgi:hypothetical protein